MSGQITPMDLRRYWCQRYQLRFGKQYPSKDTPKDHGMLRRILGKYSGNHYLIMAAIDECLKTFSECTATINYFSSDGVFASKFSHLIRLAPVMHYKALINSCPEPLWSRMKHLVQEYEDYCLPETISDDEKLRKALILQELSKITKKPANTEENLAKIFGSR